MKTETLSFKIESELKTQFQTITKYNHRPASQVIRELIRDYVLTNNIPSQLTTDVMTKSELNENLHSANNLSDLCNKLGI